MTSAIVVPLPVLIPARTRADDLARVYKPFFQQDFPLYSGPTEEDFAPHRTLIAWFVETGRIDPLVDMVEFALDMAEKRIADVMIDGVPATPPEGPLNLAFANGFQASMWIAEFALMWAREVERRAPQTAGRLRRMLAPPNGPFGFFGFLGGCLGYRRFNVSTFFEHNADYLCVERDRLCRAFAERRNTFALSA